MGGGGRRKKGAEAIDGPHPLSTPLRRCLARLLKAFDAERIAYAALTPPQSSTLSPALAVLTSRPAFERIAEMAQRIAEPGVVTAQRRLADELLLGLFHPWAGSGQSGRHLLRFVERLVDADGRPVTIDNIGRQQRFLEGIDLSVAETGWSPPPEPAAPLPETADPMLFVLAGAHGVGKTTTLAECLRIFEQLGIAVRPFHHILDTRAPSGNGNGGRPDGDRAEAIETKATPPPRKALWRRLVPGGVKLVITSFLDEARYIRGVGGLVRRAQEAGALALADRYVYDRWVDLRIRARPATQIAAVRLACSLMPRPRLLIRLEDEPTAIRRRKPELETDEIRRYQDDLAGLCGRLGVIGPAISIGGRAPAAVASEAVERMIEALGGEVLGFLRPLPEIPADGDDDGVDDGGDDKAPEGKPG